MFPIGKIRIELPDEIQPTSFSRFRFREEAIDFIVGSKEGKPVGVCLSGSNRYHVLDYVNIRNVAGISFRDPTFWVDYTNARDYLDRDASLGSLIRTGEGLYLVCADRAFHFGVRVKLQAGLPDIGDASIYFPSWGVRNSDDEKSVFLFQK
jgi:hypothetical protein